MITRQSGLKDAQNSVSKPCPIQLSASLPSSSPVCSVILPCCCHCSPDFVIVPCFVVIPMHFLCSFFVIIPLLCHRPSSLSSPLPLSSSCSVIVPLLSHRPPPSSSVTPSTVIGPRLCHRPPALSLPPFFVIVPSSVVTPSYVICPPVLPSTPPPSPPSVIVPLLYHRPPPQSSPSSSIIDPLPSRSVIVPLTHIHDP